MYKTRTCALKSWRGIISVKSLISENLHARSVIQLKVTPMYTKPETLPYLVKITAILGPESLKIEHTVSQLLHPNS